MSAGKRKMLDEQVEKEEELKELPDKVKVLEKEIDQLTDALVKTYKIVEMISREEAKKWKMQMSLNKSIVKEITKLKNIK